MSRIKIIAFIGIYITIILAMLFVFLFVQERFGAHLFLSPKINAYGQHSLMHREKTPENYYFLCSHLVSEENTGTT
ncbi:MAG: hypothetical protein WCU00_14005 [Candidatus Latescibacterota bacterium]|jgi:hypothetical protein